MEGKLLFRAELVPHRSLSARGLNLLLLAVCILCSLNALVFVLLGAWPVAGFTGIELMLAAILFRANAREAKSTEIISLSYGELVVMRIAPNGEKRRATLQPAWLRLSLEDRPGRAPVLFARERQRQIELARDLGEEEKRSLAEALAKALERLRNPVFDNPQLREAD
jgi:uncharacterized membrane protein